MFVNGNNYLKEYETQVLQMSVPPTESDQDSLKKNNNGNVSNSASGHRYHIARYPSFNLDSISYITKDRTSKTKHIHYKCYKNLKLIFKLTRNRML